MKSESKQQIVDYNGCGFFAIPYKDPKIIIKKGALNGFDIYRPTSILGKTKLWCAKKASRFFRKEVGVRPDLLEPIFDQFGENVLLSLYTGTKGYFRKITAKIFNKNGKALSFAKFAETEQAKKLIFYEHNTLKRLEQLDIKSAYVPKILAYEKDVLFITTVNGKSAPKRFLPSYSTFLNELSAKTYKDGKCMVHGDFAPWNIQLAGRPFIFDWECSKDSVPLYDFFHFIVQTEILINKSHSKRIFAKINRHRNFDRLQLEFYLKDTLGYFRKLVENDGIYDDSRRRLIETRKELLRVFLGAKSL